MTHDPSDMRDRMDRAVRDLPVPDVTAAAMTTGRRHRRRRRAALAGGGVAGVAAVGLVAATLLPGAASDRRDPPSFASDPSPSRTESPTPAQQTESPTPGNASDPGGCPEPPPGWWNMPPEQIRAELADRLPAGVTVDSTDDSATGLWEGNLVKDGNPGFTQVWLHPPKNGEEEVREIKRDGETFFQLCSNPAQPEPVCESSACEVVRDADGRAVGTVEEASETTIVDGEEVPTDLTYITATLAGPDGGYVELHVAEGTRQDTPQTVHDPADVPPLTFDQVRALLQDPVWTSY